MKQEHQGGNFKPSRRAWEEKTRRTSKRKWIILGALVMLLSLAGLLSFFVSSGDQLASGMRLEGVEVGGGKEAAIAKITEIIRVHETTPIALKIGKNTTHKITLSELGEKEDARAVYDSLHNAGRSGDPVSRVTTAIQLLLRRYDARLNNQLDDKKLADYIQKLDKKVRIGAKNALFVWKDKTMMLQADQSGAVIDKEAAMKLLRGAHPERSSEIDMPMMLVPAKVTANALRPLLPQAVTIAGTPLVASIKSASERIDEQTITSWLKPTIKDDKVLLELSQEKIASFIDKIASKVEMSPRPTLKRGDIVVEAGTSGYRVDRDNSIKRLASTLQGRRDGKKAARVALVGEEVAASEQQIAVTNSNTGSGLVRLTFDDGPGYGTNYILDTLRHYNVHATFYVLGSVAERFPEQMQRIAAEGHAVGNHSFGHADLTALSFDGVVGDLARTQDSIQRTSGLRPTGMRPPYGAVNGAVREAAAQLGLSIDMWSVDPQDWAQPGRDVIVQRVLSKVGSGGVVLLHVTSQQTVDALPAIIEGIRGLGYTLE